MNGDSRGRVGKVEAIAIILICVGLAFNAMAFVQDFRHRCRGVEPYGTNCTGLTLWSPQSSAEALPYVNHQVVQVNYYVPPWLDYGLAALAGLALAGLWIYAANRRQEQS